MTLKPPVGANTPTNTEGILYADGGRVHYIESPSDLSVLVSDGDGSEPRWEDAADVTEVQAQMPVSGFNPSYDPTQIVDTNAADYGLTWTANPSIAFWRGLYWIACDGNIHGGTTELASGQRCHLFSSPDLDTLTFYSEVFSNATYTNNVVAGDGQIQPSLIVVNGTLQCYWNLGVSAYQSTLTSPTGKWTTKRVEWQTGQPVLSSTVTGGAAGGNTLSAVLDGITDWETFFPCQPTILEDGTLAAPITINSQATFDPAAVSAGETNTFLKQMKAAFVLFSSDSGATWRISEKVPNGPTTRPSGNWEQFLVEAADGTLCLFSRNLIAGGLANQSAQLVAFSSNRHAWSTSRDTELEVPTMRGNAVRGSSTRWFEAQADHPTDNVPGDASGQRYNGSLFVSRRGRDDFVPAIQYSDVKYTTVYPQMIVNDGFAYVIWTRDFAGLRSLWLTKVAVPSSDETAYVYPRHLTDFTVRGPVLHASPAPGFWQFDSVNQATSAVAVNSNAISMSAWLLPDDVGQTIIFDSRLNAGGCAFKPNGVTFQSCDYHHGVSMTPGVPTFVAVTVTPATRKISQYVSQSGAALTQVDGYARVLTVTTNPANAETITVDGTVFTFKTVPAGSTDVLIGVDAAHTATNLAAAISADGTHRASVLGTADVFIMRFADLADFAVVASVNTTLNATIPASLMNASSTPRYGHGMSATSLSNLSGRIYDGQVWASTLTLGQVKYLFNQLAASLGLSPLSGASAPGGSPTVHLTPSSTTADFPDIDDPPAADAVLTDQVLTITGEASASVELPWDGTAVTIPFQLGAVPAGGDKYVIATIDTAAHPIRLYLAGDDPTVLKANGTPVGITIDDPTRVNQVEVLLTKDSVRVGDTVIARTTASDPRLYLGSAFPEDLLTRDESTTFDLAQMRVAEQRDRPLAPFVLESPLIVTPTTTNGSPAFGVARPADATNRAQFSDRGDLGFSDGTDVVDTTIRRNAAAQLYTESELKSFKAVAGIAFSGEVTGDTTPRYTDDTSGFRSYGDGASTRDTGFGRESAGVLAIRNAFNTEYRVLKTVVARPRTVTATGYLMVASDGIVAVTDTSSARAIALPLLSTVAVGQEAIVKDESGGAGTHNITITPNATDVSGGATIDGAGSLVISANYGVARVYKATATTWAVM